jgi:hypothetical protein
MIHLGQARATVAGPKTFSRCAQIRTPYRLKAGLQTFGALSGGARVYLFVFNEGTGIL